MLSDAWLCEKLSWFVSGLSQWTLTHMVVSVTASSGRMGGGGRGGGAGGDADHTLTVATRRPLPLLCMSALSVFLWPSANSALVQCRVH